ncbi:ZN467 protein, partial [Bombycilla garrulus]|nr:ZN467 protein [Bombycilla garrulus]
CPRCARRFAHRQHLLRHLRLHGEPETGPGDGDGHGDSPAEEKPLPCPGCEMSLAWKQNPASQPGAGNGHLDEHRDGDGGVPAEEKLLICPQCGMSLTWKQNSWQHLESQALGCAQDPRNPLQPSQEPGAQDPQHPSPTAERHFVQDPQLLSQVPGANCGHAQDPPPLLQPPQVPGAQDQQPQVPGARCGQGCAQDAAQVPPAQRPFTCPQCGRGFGRKAHLARHLLVHSGTR